MDSSRAAAELGSPGCSLVSSGQSTMLLAQFLSAYFGRPCDESSLWHLLTMKKESHWHRTKSTHLGQIAGTKCPRRADTSVESCDCCVFVWVPFSRACLWTNLFLHISVPVLTCCRGQQTSTALPLVNFARLVSEVNSLKLRIKNLRNAFCHQLLLKQRLIESDDRPRCKNTNSIAKVG